MTAPRHATRPPAPRRRNTRTETARRATSRRPQRNAATPGDIDWPVRVLQAFLFLGVVAMLSLSPARTASAGLGLVPLWLVLLPASAWLALAMARRAVARG